MTRSIRWLLVGLAVLLFGAASASAQESPAEPAAANAAPSAAGPAAIVQKFGGKQSYDETEAVIIELAASGDEAVARALRALRDGDLYWRKGDEAVFIGTRQNDDYALSDPMTGEPAGTVPRGEMEKVRIKNSIRNAVTTALDKILVVDLTREFFAAVTSANRPPP